MGSHDPVQLGVMFALVLFSLCFHEYAHAWMAFRRGDDTAALLGRLTLNPIAHMDPFLSVILPLGLWYIGAPIIGGGKPVPVNVSRLKNPPRDSMLVALAGPMSNVVLAVVLTVALQVLFKMGIVHAYENQGPGRDWAAFGWDVLVMAITTNLLLAFFNMLPIPPLDGSRVLAYFLPGRSREWLLSLDRYGFAIVMLLMFSGAYRQISRTVLMPFLNAYSDLLIPS
jgi:Zn-dependent protease